jgi:hypothetical protein
VDLEIESKILSQDIKPLKSYLCVNSQLAGWKAVVRIFYIITYFDKGKEIEAAEEWKKLGICAIGWSWSKSNFCDCKSEDEVRTRMSKHHMNTKHARFIWRFVHEIRRGDLVLAYCRNNTIAYVGTVKGHCEYNTKNSIGDQRANFGYAHQREVQWWDQPCYFNRKDLREYYRNQLGKMAEVVAEIVPDSKGVEGFRQLLHTVISGSMLPGIREDTVKADITKHLHRHLDGLEEGLEIRNAEVSVGRSTSRPDFIAEDKRGRAVLIECKAVADVKTVEQLEDYKRKFGRGKDPRLFIVASRITEDCFKMAKARSIELFESELSFRRKE